MQIIYVSLSFNEVTDSRDYSLDFISNRYNQILFFIAGTSGITVYDLFDVSNKTKFAINNIGYDHPPELCLNELGEEFYLRYNDKICLCLYKSMFKSLTSNSALLRKHMQNLNSLK